jgi:hypothetical protein
MTFQFDVQGGAMPMHLLHMLGMSALPVCITDLADIEKTATLPKWRESCRAVWATVHSVTPRGHRALGRFRQAEAANASSL